MATTVDKHLNIYLQDVHAIELQALEQVRRAPKIAGDAEIAATPTRSSSRHALEASLDQAGVKA